MLGAGVGVGVFSSLAVTSSATSLGGSKRSPWLKSSASAGALQQCPGSATQVKQMLSSI